LIAGNQIKRAKSSCEEKGIQGNKIEREPSGVEG